MKIAPTVYLALATAVAAGALSVSTSYAQSYSDNVQSCDTTSDANCIHKDTDRRAGGENSARNDNVHTSEHGGRTE